MDSRMPKRLEPLGGGAVDRRAAAALWTMGRGSPHVRRSEHCYRGMRAFAGVAEVVPPRPCIRTTVGRSNAQRGKSTPAVGGHKRYRDAQGMRLVWRRMPLILRTAPVLR